MNKLSIFFLTFLLAGLLAGMSACNKALDEPLRTQSNGVKDTTSDVRAILAASPYTLFNQAFSRLGLDSAFGLYTIFAPTDSVMQAAGLTSSVIASLSTDSLYKIVAYQIVYNAYSDSLLENSPMSMRAPAVREDVFYQAAANSDNIVGQTAQQSLYLWKRGVLYVNGQVANNGESPLKARNGWIYPVNHLFTATTSNVWQVLQSRPELSMYVAAYRMVDSFYQSVYFYGPYQYDNDTAYFTTVSYVNTAAQQPPVFLTIFAPTNDAFARAGFNTLDDIRSYVARTMPAQTYQYQWEPYGYYYTYSAMDSVLKEHYLFGYGGALMYQDLLNSSLINNGVLNVNTWDLQSFASYQPITPYYTQFSDNNGTVNIKYSRNSAVQPAVLPPGGVSFPAINGIVYEIDQLFYPHN
jgi:uncharacterized surface protein with fasciclin (FAS1) repeats